jgi:hypothetical protein
MKAAFTTKKILPSSKPTPQNRQISLTALQQISHL